MGKATNGTSNRWEGFVKRGIKSVLKNSLNMIKIDTILRNIFRINVGLLDLYKHVLV